MFEIAFLEVGAGHILGFELLFVLFGRSKGRVWIVYVDVEHPGRLVVLCNEIDGAVGGPFGLVEFRIDGFRRISHCVEILTLDANPVGGLVSSFGPVVSGHVGVLPVLKAIVESWFGAFAGADEVEFSD